MASTSRFFEDKIVNEIVDSAVLSSNTKLQTNCSISVFNGDLSKNNVFFGNSLCSIWRQCSFVSFVFCFIANVEENVILN